MTDDTSIDGSGSTSSRRRAPEAGFEGNGRATPTQVCASRSATAEPCAASLDGRFFDEMNDALESLWMRYWVAELGDEREIVTSAGIEVRIELGRETP